MFLVSGLIAGCGRAPSESPLPGTSTRESVASGHPVDTDHVDAIDTMEDSGEGWGFRAEWPAALARYPALLAAVEADVREAHREIKELGLASVAYADAEGAAEVIEGQDFSTPPVETQMKWSIVFETPTLVSVSLDGYTYTGGAHALPLFVVHHLDRTHDRLLEPAALMGDPAGWRALSESIRAELYRRAEESIAEVPADQQDEVRRNSREWIDEGTMPGPEHLGLFVPLDDVDGRATKLSFIFPPYQVGSYADGSHAIEIEVTRIQPWLSPEWARALGVVAR